MSPGFYWFFTFLIWGLIIYNWRDKTPDDKDEDKKEEE